MNTSFRLATFHPLCSTPWGRLMLSQDSTLKPYSDGSCRREPDLEHTYPSISALCRAGNFAPHLRVNDHIAYMTVKRRYEDEKESHYRLVALLRVLRTFDTHEEGAEWYRGQGLALPRNCMIAGTEPLPMEKTDGGTRYKKVGEMKRVMAMPEDRKRRALEGYRKVWENEYQERARVHPAFIACEPLYVNLTTPPGMTAATLQGIFDRVPVTQTPCYITENQFEQLRALTGR